MKNCFEITQVTLSQEPSLDKVGLFSSEAFLTKFLQLYFGVNVSLVWSDTHYVLQYWVTDDLAFVLEMRNILFFKQKRDILIKSLCDLVSKEKITTALCSHAKCGDDATHLTRCRVFYFKNFDSNFNN